MACSFVSANVMFCCCLHCGYDNNTSFTLFMLFVGCIAFAVGTAIAYQAYDLHTLTLLSYHVHIYAYYVINVYLYRLLDVVSVPAREPNVSILSIQPWYLFCTMAAWLYYDPGNVLFLRLIAGISIWVTCGQRVQACLSELSARAVKCQSTTDFYDISCWALQSVQASGVILLVFILRGVLLQFGNVEVLVKTLELLAQCSMLLASPVLYSMWCFLKKMEEDCTCCRAEEMEEPLVAPFPYAVKVVV